MQRFLQEHGEVQLSALGLGMSLLMCLNPVPSVSLLHKRLDTGKAGVTTSLSCSYLFDGDSGRDFEEWAVGY